MEIILYKKRKNVEKVFFNFEAITESGFEKYCLSQSRTVNPQIMILESKNFRILEGIEQAL